MKRKSKINIPSKYVLLIVTILCVALIFLTYTSDNLTGPIKTAANYTIIPMQKGINSIGLWLEGKGIYFKDLESALAENEELKAQVEELEAKNSELLQNRYELERLQELYKLDQQYSDYETVGAYVVNKDSSNWFSTFIVDKGSNDGITEDMNVLANGGLIGIVISVGPDWAKVRSIIDDSSNVTAMMLSESDPCTVRGDLQLINDGVIRFEQLENNDHEYQPGEKVITSNTSSKFLPGILIGYVSEVTVDSNNLTRSGLITPAADFKQIQEVLIITTTKKTYDSEPVEE